MSWIEVYSDKKKSAIKVAVYSNRNTMMRAIETDRQRFNLTEKQRKPCIAFCRTFNGTRDGERGWRITVIYFNRPDYKKSPGVHVHEIVHMLEGQKRRIGEEEARARLAENLYCLIHEWGKRKFSSAPAQWAGWPT
jgi:hypothetical protein